MLEQFFFVKLAQKDLCRETMEKFIFRKIDSILSNNACNTQVMKFYDFFPALKFGLKKPNI